MTSISGDACAVVTGASAGIGRATALALARAGVPVVGVGRRGALLRRSEADESRIEPVQADVTTSAGREKVVEAVAARPLAALVHGAGVFPRAPLSEMSHGAWESAMRTNVDARLWLTVALEERLVGGRVLFVGSDAATTPRHGGGAYSVSKAASFMLWKCLATEMGDRVSFGMAKPGLVETAMLDGSIAADPSRFGARDVYVGMSDRGETISAKKVAAFFVWLLTQTLPERFVADVWDIRDESHHAEWLSGPLYTGPR